MNPITLRARAKLASEHEGTRRHSRRARLHQMNPNEPDDPRVGPNISIEHKSIPGRARMHPKLPNEIDALGGVSECTRMNQGVVQ